MSAWEKQFLRSPKQQENIPRRVMPWGFALSNGNGFFATCDKIYGICICGSVEAYSENPFALSFLLKIEISPTHFRDLNYNHSQERRPGPKRTGDISQQEISKFPTCKLQYGWSSHRRESIFHRQ